MIKRLLSYLKGYEKYALLSPLTILAEVILELILPLLMAEIIDVGIANHDTSHILRFGLYMLVIAFSSMACGALAARFASVGSVGFGSNLRKAVFYQIQNFSFADIDRFSSASLITRVTNDINTLQMMVAMALRILIRTPAMMIGALVVAFRLNADLARIILCVLPLLFLSVWLLMSACRKLFLIMQEKIDGLNATVQENLSAIRVVKAFVRSAYEKTKFKTANLALTDAALSASLRVIFMQPIMMLFLSFTNLFVLYFGGLAVGRGEMGVGELISFLGYINQILMSVLMVAMVLLQVTRATACARRVFEILDAVPDIRSPEQPASPPPSVGQVEFQSVSFKYNASGSGDNVIQDISFTAEPGQVVAIVGGTGTGKSSLVNLIPRFYDVTSGHVLVDGLDVRDYSLPELRSRIGMVLQRNQLFSGTIRENLLWGNPSASEEDLIQAAKDAQAYDFIQSFPDGFDTRIDQGGVNVSGGQKQRLCIARAMLKHPSILILDDSTSAVDSATEAQIRSSFYRNFRNTTVILIAQRISSVQNADKILVIDDGHLVGEGTHASLLAENSVYQEIYASQQEEVREL